MARSQRSSKLDTRTARLKLPVGERYFLTIGKGLALGYRRTEDLFGTWQARAWNGTRYHYSNVGRADDYVDANGADVLDFYQAQGAARAFFERVIKGDAPGPGDVTVDKAADHYLEWFREHRRSVKGTEQSIDVHIRPAFGDRRISTLTAAQIRRWLEKLAASPARIRVSRSAKEQRHRPAPQTANEKRARRASANRIFTSLKAILNRAFRDGLVSDDTAWRQVKPFEKADQARIRYLTDEEGVRLANACAPDLRKLIQAALLTGARFGELVALRVQDVNIRTKQVFVAESKSGRPRHIPLNPEGVDLFKESMVGRTGEDLLFLKSDGTPWGKNHHVRALYEACKVAKVRPAVSFHQLRHTYASHLAQAGIDLLVIAKLLGHADTRITGRHYAHLADRTLAAAVTSLPSFGGAAVLLQEVKPVRAKGGKK